MKTQTICKLVVLMGTFMLGACSVYKASSNEGISVRDIRNCTTKGCLLAHRMEFVDKHTLKDGKIIETYKAPAKKTGLNYLRAAGHGVMDVATLGIWEVAGTPIEGAISNNPNYVVARATYADEISSEIEKLEITSPNGKSETYNRK